MIFWTLVVGVFLILLVCKLNKHYVVMALFRKRIKTIDGTPVENIAPTARGKSIFGNTFDFVGMDNETIFRKSRMLAAELKKSYVQYVMGVTFYNVITAEDAELILNDQKLITKGIVYNFLHSFLRTGLLTSTDKKWFSRRKMLTPAFHFNILGEFEEIFKEESRKFVESLVSQDTTEISLTKMIPKFTLNSVCETALGVKIDDRLDGDEYRLSFSKIEQSFIKRTSNPILFNDFIYNTFVAHTFAPHLHVVHEFSSGIIEKRRQLFAAERKNSENRVLNGTENENDEDIHFIPKKKRYCMLDTLLHAESDGQIDHIGICEEVDTFMFEGFDTTSMGLIFGLMNLSLYPELQQKCYQEIEENIDDDLSTLNITQINKLKYLECFIKESLRLYPSVPIIMRKATSETKLANNLILPEGTQITVHIFDIMRDPKHFPNPDVFDPERFTPENSVGRHPFAYVPFSAGQRNCIGQRFAMMEIKTLIIYILKNFKVLPLVNPQQFRFEAGLIIRSVNDVKVELVRRK